MAKALFRSIGAYVPDKTLTNFDLEKIVETNDDWIVKRTGIRNRHVASKEQATSDLALEASKKALKRANMEASELDLIIVSTITGDFMNMPSTACVLADKLGVRNVPAYDSLAACSGFIYALAQAKAFIEAKMYKNILIVGAETLTKFVDYEDRATCVIFGDGAGAAVICATHDEDINAIKDVHISSDGKYQDFIITPGGGSKNPLSYDMLNSRENFIKMRGNETFKVAVRTLSSDVEKILEKNCVKSEDIKFFVPHQANYRIIKAVGDVLGLKTEQVVLTVEKYGNTSAASIPMAINDIYEEAKLKKGDLMLLDAFGGGLTWGSALVPFGGE